ncbi:NEW3 domain-containing protein [Arthrobacter sp. HY1533]|uniref:NEW3 domain-containing protein n=1 Tax=Arthrobacter sp. HY1533 TaxID=2970919 RepID=UPI0022B9F430|nr:NEW3 domain-containing protein [Arthrobacter sp. HY1533]
MKAIIAMLATALVFGGAMTVITAPAGAEGSNSALTMSIAAVDLEGPAISDIVVTLKNTSATAMSDVSVKVTGPINWTLYPETQTLPAALAAGATATVKAEIHVPNNPEGSLTRNFTATATYAGGDGVKTSFTERNQFTGAVPASLAELFDNVGTTTVAAIPQGNYDGEKNSFSRERLAEKGITPGAKVTAAGTEFTWPAAAAGEPDNVSAKGQTFTFSGKGSKIAFLGSGVAQGAVGEATVHYTDGSSSKGTFGFPNWGFDPATAHGAKLEVTTKGRNTPAGYANAEYDYRMFSNTIGIDQAKTVSMVTLPNNSGIHIFAMAFVPAAEVPPTTAPAATAPATTAPATTAPATTAPATSAPATTAPATSAPATVDPSVAPSAEPTTAEPSPTTVPSTQAPTIPPVTTVPTTDAPGTGAPTVPATTKAAAPGSTTTASSSTGGTTPASQGPSTGAGLSETGSSSAPLLAVAGLLVFGGLALTATSEVRRRNRASHR